MLVFLALSAVVVYLSIKLLLWYLTESNNGYWKERGIASVQPKEFSSYYDLIMGKAKAEDFDLYCYNKYRDEPVVGTMEVNRPVLFIRDPELLKSVQVKDFEHFVNRRDFNVVNDLATKFLFMMHDQEWKDLRSTISPTFTSGKMRRMFDYFQRSGKDLQAYVEAQLKKGSSSIELRSLYGRYVMDLIASTTFGINGNCLTQEDSEFLKQGQGMVQYGSARAAKAFLMFMFPKLAKLLRVQNFEQGSTDFFKGVITQVLKERRQNPGNYKDFVQLMMDAQANNKAALEVGSEELDRFEKEAELKATSHYQVSDDNILANGLIFILGGFEGTESTMTLATYLCALHPEKQRRLREEIDSVLEEYSGEICYDAITKMTYLDMFVSEVTRLYPSFTRTERVVTKEFKIPGKNTTLPVGTVVVIPIKGIQRDAKYFPDPEKFDPERFSPENKQNRHPYAYQTFGHGPRNCIGMRYALIEIKSGLVQILRNFEIAPSADTLIPLEFETAPNVIKPVKSLGVSFKPRA